MSFKKDTKIQDVIQPLLDLHNKTRVTANLKPLKLNNDLNEYAQAWAGIMAESVHLVHSNIENVLKLGFSAVGENIAWNQDSVPYVFDDWMRSHNHRENILKPLFTQVGFGLACNNKNQPYWCAVFAD